LPQLRVARQDRLQSRSTTSPVVSSIVSAHARVVAWSDPHRQGESTSTRQGGHGPSWQRAEHVWSQCVRARPQTRPHVGTGSAQDVRWAESAVWPHGQCVTRSGERGQCAAWAE